MVEKKKLELTDSELRALVFWAEAGLAKYRYGSYVRPMVSVWKKVYQFNPCWLGDSVHSELGEESALFEIEDKAFFHKRLRTGVKS